MPTVSELLSVSDEEKRKILKESGVTPEEFSDQVRIIKEWLTQNQNFPQGIANCENRIKVALLNCKMSLEKTKRFFEGYFTLRTMYEDIFDRVIYNERFEKVQKLSTNVIIPKLLPNLCRLQLFKCTDVEVLADDGLDYYTMTFILIELRVVNDFFLSNEIIIDLELFSWKNMMKFTPSINFKLVHFLTALQLRLYKIHIINAPPFWDKIWILVKSLLPTKFLEKFVVHDSPKDLQKYIPLEYLPSNYGGGQKSMEELHAIWVEVVKANNDILRESQGFKLKELLKDADKSVSNMGMGVEGSFKKLSID